MLRTRISKDFPDMYLKTVENFKGNRCKWIYLSSNSQAK